MPSAGDTGRNVCPAAMHTTFQGCTGRGNYFAVSKLLQSPYVTFTLRNCLRAVLQTHRDCVVSSTSSQLHYLQHWKSNIHVHVHQKGAGQVKPPEMLRKGLWPEDSNETRGRIFKPGSLCRETRSPALWP